MILLTKFKLKQQSGRQSPLTVLKCFQGFARQTILQIHSQGTPNFLIDKFQLVKVFDGIRQNGCHKCNPDPLQNSNLSVGPFLKS